MEQEQGLFFYNQEMDTINLDKSRSSDSALSLNKLCLHRDSS